MIIFVYVYQKILLLTTINKIINQFAGLPHTQGIQGIFKLKKISGKLMESQGILIYFFNSGKF